MTIIDSHAHLDVLLGRRRCDTLAQFGSIQDLNQGGTLILEEVVANFVYPEHWESAARISGDSKVYCTYGVHPRRINPCSPSHLWIPRLKRLSTTEKCVGIGEVGLDYTTSSPTEQASQRRFLEEVLDKVFRPSIHVLVLHCRDNGDGAAARDTLQILTRKGLANAKIHRHCFSGTQNELVEWRRTLSNCYYGFTTTLFRKEETRMAAKRCPLNRFLLETDCPYLGRFPGDVKPVVEVLCSLKGMASDAVVANANRNAMDLYGFPSA